MRNQREDLKPYKVNHARHGDKMCISIHPPPEMSGVPWRPLARPGRAFGSCGAIPRHSPREQGHRNPAVPCGNDLGHGRQDALRTLRNFTPGLARVFHQDTIQHMINYHKAIEIRVAETPQYENPWLTTVAAFTEY